MGAGYLLDTNVIIDFSANKIPEKSLLKLADIIDDLPRISIINKIELLSFNIAATALIFNLTLITHNTNDFKNIEGLQSIDSYLL